jgi:hypothetical protein
MAKNCFGRTVEEWKLVTAEDMCHFFANVGQCHQSYWLEEYWNKKGYTTDKERTADIPEESDSRPMWSFNTCASFLP